jgi:hypothetical protein
MSWGTDFTTDIFLPYLTFETLSEIDDKIKELEEEIVENMSKLKMWAASNPSDVISNDYKDDVMTYISSEINSIMELLLDHNIALYQIKLYRKYFIEHNEE